MEKIVNSKSEAIANFITQRVLRGKEGWTFLPVDEPDRCLTGLLMYRGAPTENDPDAEEYVMIQWPVVAGMKGEMKVEYENLNLEEFLKFCEKHKKRLVPADAPKQLKKGVALFDLESETSFVKRCHLSQFHHEKTDKEKKIKTLSLLDEIRGNWSETKKEHQETIASIISAH